MLTSNEYGYEYGPFLYNRNSAIPYNATVIPGHLPSFYFIFNHQASIFFFFFKFCWTHVHLWGH